MHYGYDNSFTMPQIQANIIACKQNTGSGIIQNGIICDFANQFFFIKMIFLKFTDFLNCANLKILQVL